MMKNLLIAIIIVVAGSLTFLLIQRLNTKEIKIEEELVQEEEQPAVASGEYLDYERFDPQYYNENRIVYLLLDQTMSALDSDINANMLSIPETMVIVRTEGTNISELKNRLALNTDARIVEVDITGRVIKELDNISSLSQLLRELGN